MFECYPQKVAVVRLPIHLFNSYRVTHRKMLFLKCFRTGKRVVFGLSTENSQCLSLPTKKDFFQKVPTEEQKRLGATQIGNHALKSVVEVKHSTCAKPFR